MTSFFFVGFDPTQPSGLGQNWFDPTYELIILHLYAERIQGDEDGEGEEEGEG
jgi:hypothetical protein